MNQMSIRCEPTSRCADTTTPRGTGCRIGKQLRRRMIRVTWLTTLALLVVACSSGVVMNPPATETGTAPENVAGMAWRLVRSGGGFVSPTGTTGITLFDVTWSSMRFVAVGQQGTIVRSSDGDRWTAALDA